MAKLVRNVRQTCKTIGLVPTMGALHEGHLSLVRKSVAECDCTIVTIFVNPTQFGPQEDFEEYPRNLDTDVALLAEEKANVVFAPPTHRMYPEGFSTYVEPPTVAQPLEGLCRPGHFRGVATIVLKLFNLVPADTAYFGQKDYQQSRVIEDMARDLNVPTQIKVCPIIREADGLAMSSRNRYLGREQRQRSCSLYNALQKATQLAQQGERSARALSEQMQATLVAEGVTQIDYATVVDPRTLHPVDDVTQGAVAVIAARVGCTRLIDNCLIKVE